MRAECIEEWHELRVAGAKRSDEDADVMLSGGEVGHDAGVGHGVVVLSPGRPADRAAPLRRVASRPADEHTLDDRAPFPVRRNHE
jgi:hypothetical protein